MKFFSLRAAAFAAVLFISAFPQTGLAQGKPKAKTTQKTETFRDIIEKAQLLSLQKDRQQAVMILEMALKKEGPRSVGAAEIKKQIIELSRIFISDKTQGLFELGMSFLPKDINQANQKITEALRLEPDNVQLLLTQMRLSLNKRDCSQAAGIFKKQNLKRLTPIDPELDLMQTQIAFCQKSMVELQAFFVGDYKKNPFLKYWYNMEIQRCIEERNFSRAKDLIVESQKMDSNYAEVFFLDWKLNQQAENKNVPAGQKYLLMCKSVSPQEFRSYFIDPTYCSNTQEVEKVGNN